VVPLRALKEVPLPVTVASGVPAPHWAVASPRRGSTAVKRVSLVILMVSSTLVLEVGCWGCRALQDPNIYRFPRPLIPTSDPGSIVVFFLHPGLLF